MLFSVNYARPSETGFWPLVVPVFKFVASLGAWEAAAWGIGELLDGAEEAEKSTGDEAGDPVTAGHRKYTLAQMKNLKVRGVKMLSGPPLAIYKKMVEEARVAIQDPALTMADAAAFRTMLFRYTVKHGDCTVFPKEIAWCEDYKKKWPGKKTGSSQVKKPQNVPTDVSPLPRKSNTAPYLIIGGIAVAIWFFTK
jgi:hypothetical protein